MSVWTDLWSVLTGKAAGKVSTAGGIAEAVDFSISRTKAPPKRDMRALLAAYSAMPRLRAIVDRISWATAATPWDAYRTTSKTTPRAVTDRLRRIVEGQPTTAHAGLRRTMLRAMSAEGEIEHLDGHPALDVVNRKTMYLTGLQMRRLVQVHRELVGEAFIVIERYKPRGKERGLPAELWPFPPSDVIDLPTNEHPYYRLNLPGGATRMVHRDDAIWMRDPDPLNPYGRGVGVAKTLANELDADEYAAQTTSALFYNRGVPDTMVVLPGANMSEMDRFKEKLREDHGGHMKARVPHVTNATDMKIQQIAQSFVDMDLAKLREFESGIIRETWGIPPEILGNVSNSNRATITQSDIIFSRWVLVPRLEDWQDHLNASLVPEFGDPSVMLTYESPVPTDRDLELDAAKAAPFARSFDEWREAQGLPSLGGKLGAMHFMPLGMTLVDLAAQSQAPAVPATPTPPEDAPVEVPAADPASEDTPLPEEPTPPTAEDVSEGKILRLHRPAMMAKADQSRIDAIVRAIDASALTDVLDPLVRQQLLDFMAREMDTLGADVDLNVIAPLADRYLREFGAERITGMVNETTREAIRATIAEGLAAGENRLDLLSRVQDVFADADGYRAENIARTESLRASNWAITQGQALAGIEQRQWVAILDNRVRPTHAALDGQIRSINEPFSFGAKRAMFPGGFGDPSEDCACRCTTAPVMPEDDGTRGVKAIDVEAVAKAYDARLRPFETKATEKIREGFRRQRQAVLAAVSQQFAQRRSLPRRARRTQGER